MITAQLYLLSAGDTLAPVINMGDINGKKNELQSNGTGVKVGRAKYFPASTGQQPK